MHEHTRVSVYEPLQRQGRWGTYHTDAAVFLFPLQMLPLVI